MPLSLIQMEPIDPKRKRFSGLWRNPDFLKLWTGQTISILGSHITDGGLPLLALITLQSTPFQMGLLQAIGSAPVLLFSLAAGVWVDRLRRRPVMIAADLGRAFILMTIPLAAAFGWLSMGQIYIVIALAGFLTVLFNTAYRAYLPSLVERENIVEGNAKLTLSESAAEVVGPGLTGVLVQTITAPVAILFDALSFLFSVVTLAAIRKPEPVPLSAEEHQSMYQEARQGMRMLFQQPVLLALTAEAATSSFFGNFIGVLYALYAIRELGLSPAAIGITVGVGGVSSLVGAILAERAVNKRGLGPMLIRFFFIDKLFGFLIPIAASFPSLGLGFLLFSQCGDIFGTIYRIHTLSLRQSLTPTHLQGRVNASIELLTAGVAPIGALLGGYLGQKLGAQATLFIAVIGISLSGFWLVFSPIRKLKNFPSSQPGSQ